MNSFKELKLEDLAKLEATKLFKDLGYELKQIDYHSYVWDETFTHFTYEKYIDEDTTENISINQADENLISISRWYCGEPEEIINIIELIYPITKLLEELQIDIKQVYFNNVKDDNNE